MTKLVNVSEFWLKFDVKKARLKSGSLGRLIHDSEIS